MDVVLTKKVWARTQNPSYFKTASNSFQSKHEKGVGTPFPRVPVPLHPRVYFYYSIPAKRSSAISSTEVKAIRNRLEKLVCFVVTNLHTTTHVINYLQMKKG